MKYKTLRVASPIILLLILLFIAACDDDYEGFTEVITPLRCTIPGKLQLDDDTQSLLSQYKK